MNLFDKQLGQTSQNDLHAWMDQVERHINYLQERMEYGFRQLEKRLEEQKHGAEKEG